MMSIMRMMMMMMMMMMFIWVAMLKAIVEMIMGIK